MNTENTQIIEINGIKMEVDMRHAKRIDIFKVGSPVKLLIKTSHSEPEVRSGVVVGFEPFSTAPTIIVAYLYTDYNGASIKTAYINEKTSEKYELVMSIDDHLPFAKADVVEKLDKKIEKLMEEANDVRIQRDYFLKHFNCYFEGNVSVSGSQENNNDRNRR